MSRRIVGYDPVFERFLYEGALPAKDDGLNMASYMEAIKEIFGEDFEDVLASMPFQYDDLFCGDFVLVDSARAELFSATAIYTPQDDKKLLEKHEATLDKMEKDPECSEEDKERIWRAIQEISRGY